MPDFFLQLKKHRFPDAYTQYHNTIKVWFISARLLQIFIQRLAILVFALQQLQFPVVI